MILRQRVNILSSFVIEIFSHFMISRIGAYVFFASLLSVLHGMIALFRSISVVCVLYNRSKVQHYYSTNFLLTKGSSKGHSFIRQTRFVESMWRWLYATTDCTVYLIIWNISRVQSISFIFSSQIFSISKHLTTTSLEWAQMSVNLLSKRLFTSNRDNIARAYVFRYNFFRFKRKTRLVSITISDS